MFDFTKPSLSQVVMWTLNYTLIVDYYEGPDYYVKRLGMLVGKSDLNSKKIGETAPFTRLFMIGQMKK